MPLILANQSAPRRTARTPIAVPVDISITPPYSNAVAGQINSGELVYKTVNNLVASLATPGASNANAASCVGISQDQYPPLLTAGLYLPPVFGDPMALMVTVYEDGDHLMNATAGDVYQPYLPVYLGANGRTIQLTASGTAVGYVSPDQRPTAAIPSGSGGGLVFGTAAVAGQYLYIRLVPALAK
jgi:hypothetical protein